MSKTNRPESYYTSNPTPVVQQSVSGYRRFAELMMTGYRNLKLGGSSQERIVLSDQDKRNLRAFKETTTNNNNY